MSWHSDRERFDEYDPPCCKHCKGGNIKEECDRCIRAEYERGYRQGKEDEINKHHVGR